MPRNSKELTRSFQLNRRAPFKEPNKLILVVCEGEITEPSYLTEFPRYERIHGIKIKPIGLGCDPETVVQRAISEREVRSRANRKRGLPAYDEVWVVFDIDEHDVSCLARAKSMADQEGIKVAISNPCFELWLLLHFEDQFADISAAEVTRRLRVHSPAYKKYICYSELKAGRSEAVRRAKALDEQHKRNGSTGNPSTGVWKLVAAALKIT